jgi:lysozyme
MAMKVSDKGVEEILSHEAIVPMPYRDSVGVWTIAVGHTKGAGAPDPAKMAKGVAIPISECIEIFKNDLPKYEAGVNKALKVLVEQHVFDAIVSFHYNTGAAARAGFIKMINEGHSPSSEAVCNAMMQWSKPPEIVGRRSKEMKLMKTGRYTANPKIGVIQADAAGNVLWHTRKNISFADAMGGAVFATPKTETITAARTIPRGPDKAPMAEAVTIPATVTDKEVIIRVQDLLKKRGYHFVGASDGVMGPNTEAAIYAFRKANNLPPFDGTIDEKLIASLVGGEDKTVAPERAEATVQQAAAKSEPVKAVTTETWYSRLGAKILAIPSMIAAAFWGALDNLGMSKEKVQPVIDFFGTVPTWLYFAGIGAVAAYIWYSQNKAEKATLDNYQEGKVL